MKRLRAAQLNRTFQGQVLSATQKRAVEERERLARAQIERAARQRDHSPPRRTYSPQGSPVRLSAPPRPWCPESGLLGLVMGGSRGCGVQHPRAAHADRPPLSLGCRVRHVLA